jgi:predicted RNA methylase
MKHPDKRPAWTMKMSNMEDTSITEVTIWIRNPPFGMVNKLEQFLKEYIPE